MTRTTLDALGNVLRWGVEVRDKNSPDRGVARVKRVFSDGKVTIHYEHSDLTVRRVLATDLEKA